MAEEKVKRYARIKYTVTIAGILYLITLLSVFQFSGLSVRLKDIIVNISRLEPAVIFLYSLAIFLLYIILDFPLVFYRSYIIEHKFGLSNQKFFQWFSDVVKSGIVEFIIFTLLIEVLFALARGYPADWWWMGSLFWIFLSVVMARLFPVLIIPLFFKYKRVEDNDELRERILGISQKMKIRILDIFEIDFSKKSVKANAALVGLGKTKRVLLTDTLKGKYSVDEITVILAHEFAHYKLRHLAKLVTIGAVSTLIMFYLFHRSGPVIFNRADLGMSDIAALPLWLLLFIIFQIIVTPISNWLSRNMEHNADKNAIEYSSNKEAFISVMNKLAEQNLSEPKPHIMAKIFFYDHPPIDERIAMAKEAR